MPTLPQLSGSEVVKIFSVLGWRKVRQKGSHIILIKAGSFITLSVPNHKIVAKGTLRSLIRSAGISVVEFIEISKGLL